MKIVALIARILLGVMFVVFGLNGFFHFIPMAPMPGGPAKDFMTILSESHYMAVVFAVQLAGGVLLLANRFVPIALVLLGPVIVNILLFHITMEPGTLPPGIVATILWFVVFASVRSAFAGIFVSKVTTQA